MEKQALFALVSPRLGLEEPKNQVVMKESAAAVWGLLWAEPTELARKAMLSVRQAGRHHLRLESGCCLLA